MADTEPAWYRQKMQSTGYRLCNCVGPQNNDPLCPCAMRNVKVVDGRYVEIRDYGPVKPEPPVAQRCASCKQVADPSWTYCPSCGAQDRI